MEQNRRLKDALRVAAVVAGVSLLMLWSFGFLMDRPGEKEQQIMLKGLLGLDMPASGKAVFESSEGWCDAWYAYAFDADGECRKGLIKRFRMKPLDIAERGDVDSYETMVRRYPSFRGKVSREVYERMEVYRQSCALRYRGSDWLVMLWADPESAVCILRMSSGMGKGEGEVVTLPSCWFLW